MSSESSAAQGQRLPWLTALLFVFFGVMLALGLIGAVQMRPVWVAVNAFNVGVFGERLFGRLP